MSEQPDEPEKNLSAADLEAWLTQELLDCNKALELRTKEASELVEGFRKGSLTGEEATERLYLYDARWGDALPGTHASPSHSDDHLLEEIDKARRTSAQQFTKRLGSRSTSLERP
jgi:hypothetical protein